MHTGTNRIAVFRVPGSFVYNYVVDVVPINPATPSNTINAHRSWFSAGS